MNQPRLFIQSVAATVDAHHLLVPNQTVLLGVSGGADSMSMMHAMASLAARPERNWRVVAAHVNHQLRPEADEEEAFVHHQADMLGLECIAERIDVAGLAEADGQGVEAAAREARYAFFRCAAAEQGASAVAVAHHADDAAETILFRIFRGTGLRGLAGMPIRRRLSETPPLELIRPLLEIPGQAIRDYCKKNGVEWREDPSNQDTQFRRNLIRHEILPMVRRDINPQVNEALRRLGRFAEKADALLTEQADTLLRKSLRSKSPNELVLRAGRLKNADPLLCSTALHLACRMLNLPERELTARHLAEVADLLEATTPDGTAVTLPDGATARRKGHNLILAL